jgi:hypothetical protein
MSLEVRGLMGRTAKGSGHHEWASRDYSDPVKCECKACPCNNQRGECEIPSKCIIGSDAACKTGLDFMHNPPKLK